LASRCSKHFKCLARFVWSEHEPLLKFWKCFVPFCSHSKQYQNLVLAKKTKFWSSFKAKPWQIRPWSKNILFMW
jgi:hypothetical protein